LGLGIDWVEGIDVPLERLPSNIAEESVQNFIFGFLWGPWGWDFPWSK